MTDWIPDLPDDARPIYERLIAALQRDIASGLLPAGARLPPQRDLAHELDIGVGTVTKAYNEAQHRGLVHGHLGRGTFVAGSAAAGTPQGSINLFHNLSPLRQASVRIVEALSRLRSRADLVDHLAYAAPFGLESHRRAVAGWLHRTASLEVDPERIVMTAGAQQAMLLTFGVLCRQGDTVFSEAGTFHGMKALASYGGYRLTGLEMDDEGLVPDALDRAACSDRGKVLYTIPTLQNPTGRVMSDQRRHDIARVARARDLWIVEDDVYAAYGPGYSPLAGYAPERTFYVSSVSKTLAPGLRTGFLVPPPQMNDRIVAAVLGTSYSPPCFGSAITAQWMEDGTADEILCDVRKDVEQRTALAAKLLAHSIEPPSVPQTLHVWLPMTELEAERVAGRALRGAIELTPPMAPIVDGSLLSGLRVCIGGTADLETLEKGLSTLLAALTSEVDERTIAVM